MQPAQYATAQNEDSSHFFFFCPETRARAQFANIGNNIISLPTQIQDQFHKTLDYLRQRGVDFSLACFLWWNLWCHRNNSIFSNAKKDNANGIRDKTINIYKLWTSQQQKMKQSQQTINAASCPKKWEKPPPSTLKINTDGSTKQNGICKVAFIIRYNTGYPTYFYSERSSSESPLQTQASAFLKGLCVMLDSGLKRIVA